MTNAAEIVHMIPQFDDGLHAPTLKATLEQMDRILKSKTFQRANRLRSLLEYVVTAATNGRPAGQSRTARELFGKGDDFDPSLDPVIRVQFARLRRALSAYYSTEGKQDAVIIKIPNRKYTPVFQHYDSSAMNGHDETGDSDRALIAVLPFANLTNDPAQDSFCYGLTEEIAHSLAAVDSVDVVASRSSFQYKDEHVDVREAGRDLGVPLVLEGSVRMEDDNARVVAQLARSKDGIAVWSGSFDGKLNGSLQTQKDIAQQVMDTLPLRAQEARICTRLEVSHGEETTSV